MARLADTSSIVFADGVLASLFAHADQCAPEECCGVLVGRREARQWLVRRIIWADNVSPRDRRKHYAIDPDVIVHALLALRGRDDRLLGFYHSHPSSPPFHSRRDREEAWPDRLYLIIGRETDASTWSARCWHAQRQRERER